ncbi:MULTISPECIES: NUMOD3 domain-containing DNA-binding protein [Bacillus]|uniref:NUMOD3 domain-containing DNA-binding protein n=1 Tax=Bacillus TaxID=1386 RepID=UPI0021C3AC23|nr:MULTISPECIES: NUMOD3 domain-containing DNA-binding protein [Bacillus amyloliquefaciens group]MCX2885854.1 NUMOD3 domain-containing DNA-binding protein [Bacillus velezensis]MEC1250290.1 NUMOD3 domain-containing DNA-binding protein [Bacillus amyloliquefaciens]MEC2254414.1 NUMOD3 domain-containing DNA-binding protein [Bacillus amyloliquefaciens]MED0832248.1 NUMOD3 domain-containing DNA-binding protein [Bacillus amyloliquefaciens]MED1579958.1 NUMOD3 domain-containing DNA-binding protein [Bacill
MKSGVYKITNKNTGKFYIGSSEDCEKRLKVHFRNLKNNRHINRYLNNSFNKHGEQVFIGEVVHILPKEEAMAKEQWYIDNFYEEMYNISKSAYRGGDLTSYHPDKTNIILKRADSLKKVYLKMSPEEKAKRWQYVQGENNPMFGRKHTETTKLKISNHNKLYYSTHDNPFKGKKHSEESKAKLSEYASQRVGEKNPFYGKTHSDEFKTYMSKKFKGRKPKNSRPVIIDGTEYESATEASRQLNVVPATILHRIKSKNDKYSGYFYK